MWVILWSLGSGSAPREPGNRLLALMATHKRWSGLHNIGDGSLWNVNFRQDGRGQYMVVVRCDLVFLDSVNNHYQAWNQPWKCHGHDVKCVLYISVLGMSGCNTPTPT